MKIFFPEIDYLFDTECGKINTVIIENPKLFCSVLSDIAEQLSGNDGKSVLSKGDKILQQTKYLELLDSFVPFDINTKSLVTKLCVRLEETAVSDAFYAETTELIGKIEGFLYSLSFELPCDIEFTKMNVGSLVKAAGIEICNDSESIAEKIIDYIQLVTELIAEKLFITVNLRSYISDKETELLMQTVLSHGYHLLMIENCEHERLAFENRIIMDKDLCLIY